MFGYLSLDIICSSKLTVVLVENCGSLLGTDNACGQISLHIIQQIVTLSKYGHDALDICHPLVTDIRRYDVASNVGRKSEVKKC